MPKAYHTEERAKICPECQAPYMSRNLNQVYCSPTCYRKHCKKRYTPVARGGLATATVGAMHEYLVQYDLMRRGYTVFRSASPSCPCDLLILLADSQCVRVEVRTGHNYKDQLHFPVRDRDSGRQDVYAVVDVNARISYVRVTSRCPTELDGAVVDFRAPGPVEKESPV
jgi:hypothetical protein